MSWVSTHSHVTSDRSEHFVYLNLKRRSLSSFNYVYILPVLWDTVNDIDEVVLVVIDLIVAAAVFTIEEV